MVQSLLELQTKAMAKADFHLVTFVQENFLNNHVSVGGDILYRVLTFSDNVILLRSTMSS